MPDVQIARVGADGDGIAADGDRPVFVPFTLPGETVRIAPGPKRGDGYAATVETILTPSPERVEPPCPHFSQCGGCTLQHWRDDAYAGWKSGLLARALERAGFAPEVTPLVRTPPGARRRIDLALRRDGGRVPVGLHEHRGKAIVDLAVCPVQAPAIVALIAPLRALLTRLSIVRREGSAVINLLASGADLLLRTDAEPNLADRDKLIAFARAHDLPRLSWARDNGTPETICALRPAQTEFSGVTLQPPPGAFLQASDEGEAAIVAAVLAGLPGKRTRRSSVAELYAGCGTLSFAIAREMRVVAFEGDAAAVGALKRASNAAGLTGRIEATQRDLARQPLSAKELSAHAAIMLDPPFAGAAAQMGAIAQSGVKRVIYVSCNPAALARDAAMLHGAGYRLLAATPIDQFLWSARLESVCVFGL